MLRLPDRQIQLRLHSPEAILPPIPLKVPDRGGPQRTPTDGGGRSIGVDSAHRGSPRARDLAASRADRLRRPAAQADGDGPGDLVAARRSVAPTVARPAPSQFPTLRATITGPPRDPVLGSRARR